MRNIIHECTEKPRQHLAETGATPGAAAYHAGKRLELIAMQLEGCGSSTMRHSKGKARRSLMRPPPSCAQCWSGMSVARKAVIVYTVNQAKHMVEVAEKAVYLQ